MQHDTCQVFGCDQHRAHMASEFCPEHTAVLLAFRRWLDDVEPGVSLSGDFARLLELRVRR